METIGTGKGVAALLNARAKKVTPAVVRALTRALPNALVLVSEDFEQARRHAARIVAAKPYVVLGGGGDGSIVRLLNLLREASPGALPTIGVLKLGTGNALANVCNAGDYFETVRRLPSLALPLPTRVFDLVEVEDTVCHFAGVGWDARVINDYYANLDKRSSALVGSRISTRIHKGLGGYMYSLFRLTIPGEVTGLVKHGQARVTLENLGGEAYTLDSQAQPIPIPGPNGEPPRVLYDGVVSVGAAATEPEWGFGFRAFPFAQAVPGFLNVRVYDRPALHATRNMFKLWRGNFPQPGMHDFYVTRARMRFSRPMPFQIGGDAYGTRETIDYAVAAEKLRAVDWPAATEYKRD